MVKAHLVQHEIKFGQLKINNPRRHFSPLQACHCQASSTRLLRNLQPQCSIMERSWLMEEEERQACLHPIIEDGGGNGHAPSASGLPRAATSAEARGGPGGCLKRTVRIAESDPQSPTNQAKQASIRIYEARCKTKIKVCKRYISHYTMTKVLYYL